MSLNKVTSKLTTLLYICLLRLGGEKKVCCIFSYHYKDCISLFVICYLFSEDFPLVFSLKRIF